MKIRIKREEEKTTALSENGKVLFVWYKSVVGDKDIAAILKETYKNINLEIVEE